MKQMKCPDCEATFQAETAEAMMMGDMHAHYMKEHGDVMKNSTEENKKVWMEKFNADFEAAPEV